MPRIADGPKTSRPVLLASVCVVVAALYFARDVLMPLALSILLSFLMAPLVSRLERARLGRVPSVLICVTLLFSLVAGLGYVVASQLYDLANNIDQYRGNITAKVENIRLGGGVIEKIERTASEVQDRIENTTTEPAIPPATAPGGKSGAAKTEADARVPATQGSRDNPIWVRTSDGGSSPMQVLGTYLGLTLGPLGTAGIVVVFLIFVLLQREDLRDRILRLASGEGQVTTATQALDDASSRISRYLVAQAIVNGTYGVAIALGLWIIGLTIGKNDPSGTPSFPNVALWGLLCALLRFIPYIGPWVAAAFPLLVSLAVYKTVGVFIATGAMFVVVELLSNNFMEPTLYGSSTGMSTVAVLVSAVFWAWLWGPIGLLLATPMTVVLVVLGKYVPQLRFLDVLLGDEPVLDPPQRIYQRLLAMDSEEAAELLLEYREKMPLETVYDDILLPALALAEFDRARGMLDDRRQAFICSGMRDIIEEMGDRERLKIEALAKSEENAEKPARHNGRDRFSPRVVPSDCTVNVVCLPAHDEADEICNLMLAQLLNLRGYSASLISETSLASEMIEQIAAKHADVVVISALPPGAVAHARYLCKRVHARYPDVGMAVGLWRYGGDLNKAKARITCAATVAMATTLAEICGQIEQLAQRAMVREVPGAAKR